MRRSTVALIPIVGLLVLGACNNDRETTAPRYIAPSQSISANLTLSCNFTTFNQDAKNYFPFKDIAFDIIASMKKATTVADRTSLGFDLLTRLEAVRIAGIQIGSAAAGGQVALDDVGCMDVGPVPDKFNPAAALLAGVFEVRGNAASAPAATAFNSSQGHAATAAAPLWGAEPSNSIWTRSGAAYGRYLVYGYPLGADVRTAGFELGTLPASLSDFASTSSDAFRVGLCISQANLTTGVANRLVHGGAIVTDPNAILTQGTHFCAVPGAMSSLGTTTWYASLVNRATSLLAPRLLFAQTGFDGIGGLPDGWSPIIPNGLAGSSINLAYIQQPTNENVNTPIVPTVTVQAMDGTLPVPGVVITITITGNQGAPDIISNNQAVTGTDGIASFPGLQVNKAGGYTLTASGSLSGVPTNSVVSVLFNVKNQ